MTSYKSTYYPKFFATRRYFVTLVTILLTGVCILYIAVPIFLSVLSYNGMNDTITQAEAYAEETGWTDEMKAEVDALKAKRAEIAKSDKVFNWCLSASKSSSGVLIRNWHIASVLSFILIGLILVGFPVYVFVRDVYNKPKNRRPRRIMKTKTGEIEVEHYCEIEIIIDELFSMWGHKDFFDFDEN